MTTKPKTRKAPANGAELDPIFALIDAHKARTKEWSRLYSKLDNAREEFLKRPGADRKQVSKEYLDAKARLAAAERAGVEWDHRAGIAPLREQYELVAAALRRAAMRMARTKPMTPAGAAAMIAYMRRDIMEGEVD
jgi:hypothetical protein